MPKRTDINKILIIGCGLLGSSLLRRIFKKKIAKKNSLKLNTIEGENEKFKILDYLQNE